MSGAVIASVGAMTAVGLNARQTAFLLRAGLPAMAASPIANGAGEAVTMGFVPTIDPALTGPERLCALARGPFAEATAPLQDLRTAAYVAVDEDLTDGPLATRMLETTLARALPGSRVSVEPHGEAAPGRFLPAAAAALEAGQIDAAIVGGVHSDHDAAAIATLEASGRLFSRDNLDARIPGEAAAFFVLMRPGDARRRSLPALARVRGVGTGREHARPDNDAAAFEAFGMTAAVRAATASFADDGLTAGWLLTDLTGEMRRLYEWEAVFARAQDVLGRPYIIESPAQRIGYLGAAAVPLFTVLAALAWGHGFAPSPLALAIAGNDGGDRVAVALETA